MKTNRIQFVGACNPPTDAGRVTMSSRFLRHASLLLVDFPDVGSLTQSETTLPLVPLNDNEFSHPFFFSSNMTFSST